MVVADRCREMHFGDVAVKERMTCFRVGPLDAWTVGPHIAGRKVLSFLEAVSVEAIASRPALH